MREEKSGANEKMWHKEYKDYPRDEPLKKERLYPSNGIVGCEMHEINGWGDTIHHPATKNKKRGRFHRWLASLFGKKQEASHEQ